MVGTTGGKETTLAEEQGTDHSCVGLREGLEGVPFLGPPRMTKEPSLLCLTHWGRRYGGEPANTEEDWDLHGTS